MLGTVIVNGKEYRKGYTTGTTASGAAKAAAWMLFSRLQLDEVDINTPSGVVVTLDVDDVKVSGVSAECSVTKDAGDDPDVTNKMKIFARAKFSEIPGVRISAGKGIGRVTLPGLKVAVGAPAINPVPLKMISDAVSEVMPPDEGVNIEIWIPDGEEIAKKTYNPKLGIIGGISILGTTGIVSPMSEEAWKEAINIELDVLKARGRKSAIFTFGNYGEDFAFKNFGVEKMEVVKISNFLGFMLEKAAEKGFESVIVMGVLGKLIKVSAGIFHTHSKIADARMETLSSFAAISGASQEVVRRIFYSNTTEEAAVIIKENGLESVFEFAVDRAAKKCTGYTFSKVNVGAVLFDMDGKVLAMDGYARDFLDSAQGQFRK
jgi:cobalt-precorrin-5B (C1)-methyltransferase